jgi:hypothetical protein
MVTNVCLASIAMVDNQTFGGELAEVGIADWDREVSLAVLLEAGRRDQANLSTYKRVSTLEIVSSGRPRHGRCNGNC